jgi:hypothetical protein
MQRIRLPGFDRENMPVNLFSLGQLAALMMRYALTKQILKRRGVISRSPGVFFIKAALVTALAKPKIVTNLPEQEKASKIT